MVTKTERSRLVGGGGGYRGHGRGVGRVVTKTEGSRLVGGGGGYRGHGRGVGRVVTKTEGSGGGGAIEDTVGEWGGW